MGAEVTVLWMEYRETHFNPANLTSIRTKKSNRFDLALYKRAVLRRLKPYGCDTAAPRRFIACLRIAACYLRTQHFHARHKPSAGWHWQFRQRDDQNVPKHCSSDGRCCAIRICFALAGSGAWSSHHHWFSYSGGSGCRCPSNVGIDLRYGASSGLGCCRDSTPLLGCLCSANRRPSLQQPVRGSEGVCRGEPRIKQVSRRQLRSRDNRFHLARHEPTQHTPANHPPNRTLTVN